MYYKVYKTFHQLSMERIHISEAMSHQRNRRQNECKRATFRLVHVPLKYIYPFSLEPRPRGYTTFFMLNSLRMEFFLLINVTMPTNVGILTFISRKIAF